MRSSWSSRRPSSLLWSWRSRTTTAKWPDRTKNVNVSLILYTQLGLQTTRELLTRHNTSVRSDSRCCATLSFNHWSPNYASRRRRVKTVNQPFFLNDVVSNSFGSHFKDEWAITKVQVSRGCSLIVLKCPTVRPTGPSNHLLAFAGLQRWRHIWNQPSWRPSLCTFWRRCMID